MLDIILTVARYGISHTKVEPGMVLTAARAIYQTIYGRDGSINDIPYAFEGDEVRIEAADPYHGVHQYTCTNLSNLDEVGSIPVDNLEDVFREYT